MSHEMNTVLGLYNYWIVIFLMMTGFYVVIAKGNLVKKIIGLPIPDFGFPALPEHGKN